jgi:hypothetical protein
VSYTFDKSDNSIVINGFEKGMAPSPNLGVANLQCTNISTLTGETMCNFARLMDSELFSSSMAASGTILANGSLITYSFTANPTFISFLQPGNWIKILTSSVAELVVGTSYFIDYSSTATRQMELSAVYDNTGGTLAITSTLGGTFTFEFLPNTSQIGGIMTKPVASATETYFDGSKNIQYRYYVMDTEGHVWVNDTAVSNNGLNYWALIDTQTARGAVYGGGTTEQATGLAYYNGTLIMFIGELACFKLTATLGINPVVPSQSGWASSNNTQAHPFAVYNNSGSVASSTLNSTRGSTNPHFCLNTKNGSKLIWTDNSYVGYLQQASPNPISIFSYAKVTASSSSGILFTINDYIGGATPTFGLPITFWTTGTLPANIVADTLYYIFDVTVGGTFKVATSLANASAGTAVAFAGFGTGSLYYNTFDLNNSSTFTWSSQALILPFNEISQSLVEIGSSVLIGCNSNALYFWDTVSPLPSGYLYLPEGNVSYMVTANNMAFIFAGSRGNIYISNGNTASVVTTVPDYITGRPDPYYIWGGAMYLRGRIWFSIQDQTSSLTGNAGGVWSFVPTQNFYPGQDTGLALHVEHQSSYGTYNGMANLLIPQINQQSQGVQYFSAWTSSVNSPTYGIDASSTLPYAGGQTVIETDYIPIGNFVDKQNFTWIVTKYDAPLVAGEQVQVYYRTSITGAYTALGGTLGGIDSTTGSTGVLFNYPVGNPTNQIVNIMFKIVLTSTATTPSFVRFKELRIRR